MIDAERMLSSLVRNALSGGSRGGRRRGRRGRRGLGRSLLSGSQKGAVALGALGVAIAAFEHFTKGQARASKFDDPAPSRPPAPPQTPAGSPPPPPPPQTPAASSTTPPAPPHGSESQAEALLLVRAMIAAAHADHRLDEQERARILEALDASGLGKEERDFLLAELDSPLAPATLAVQAGSADLARQVYLASLMAIEVDTPTERDYLAKLASALGLSPRRVDELEQFVQGAK